MGEVQCVAITKPQSRKILSARFIFFSLREDYFNQKRKQTVLLLNCLHINQYINTIKNHSLKQTYLCRENH